MGLSRDDMLRELELLPVWRLRHPAPPKDDAVIAQAAGLVEAEPQAEVPAADIQASAAPITAAPAIVTPDDAATLPLPVPEPAVAEPDPVAVQGFDGMPHDEEYLQAMQSWPEFADSVAQPLEVAAEQPLVQPQGDRRSKIMALDWQALQQDVPECEACNLAQTRTQTVFGVGDPNAEWLFVGEAPGAEEDRRGEPFVGPAGQLLDNMLAAITLKRGDNVYIANVLKCRPPANRDPHGEEVVKCDPYLKRQVELIKPRLIVALGKFAAQSLLASDGSIASLRGKLHDFHGVPVIVTYHPAYLLRNLPDKARAWDDLCFARDTMRGLQLAASPSSAE